MAKVREAVGLDIGTSGVRAAHLSFAKHPPSLINFGQVSLPFGAVREGEVVDPAVVTQAITELWRRAGFRRKTVSISIANPKVVGRAVDLPFLTEAELRTSLAFQVGDSIPMPVEDAVLDFQVLSEFVTEHNDRMMKIFLVAAQRDMISMYVNVVESAGLMIEAIDFAPLALIRSVGQTEDDLSRPAGTGEAIIDIGAGISNIVVHQNGHPRMTRILSAGGQSLTDAIAGALGVPPEEAETMKHRLGLSASAAGPAAMPPGVPTAQGESPAPEAAGRILEQRAAAFIDEIRGSIDYYHAQPDSPPISRVIVTGGGSKITNLATRLSAGLRLPVETGRPLAHVQIGKIGLSQEQLAEAEPLMGVSLGTALGAIAQ